MDESGWVLAVDHGTTSTRGATAEIDADGWVRIGTVAVGDETTLPSVVLSRPDGAVLTGRLALRAGLGAPAAAVLRARPHLAAPGGADEVLTTVGRPTTAVDVATAMIASLLHAERARRGRPPVHLVLVHPARWTPDARDALRRAGREALAAAGGDGEDVTLTAGVTALAHRLGASVPVVVVDLGGEGTEVAAVDTGGGVLAARQVAVGGEALDDALAALVLDRARPELAARIRYGGDPEAYRAWFTLRTGLREAKATLGATGRIEVPLPGHPSVALVHDDLAGLLGPGLAEVAAAVDAVLAEPGVAAGPPPLLLVRGGLAELPAVRDWLARRTGLAPAAVDPPDPGALGGHGPVAGAAWAAACAYFRER